MLSLTLFGVRFRCHVVFLAALALTAAGGFAREVTLLVAALASHELAHLYLAKGVGLAPESVDLYPYGGVAHIVGLDEADAYSETVVALAGPLSNAALAAVSFIIRDLAVFDQRLLGFFVETNALLAAFNLLPALPLDGGRVVRAYLARRSGYSAASVALAGCGKAVGAAMTLLFGLLAWFGRVYPALLAIGALVYVGARGERATARFRLLRRAIRKREELVGSGVLPVEQLIAVEKTAAGRVLRSFLPGRYHVISIVDEQLALIGAIAEPELLDGMIALGSDATLAEILRWLNRAG